MTAIPYYGADSTHGDFHGGVPYRGDVLPLDQFSEVYGQAERGDWTLNRVLAGHGTRVQKALRGRGFPGLFIMSLQNEEAAALVNSNKYSK